MARVTPWFTPVMTAKLRAAPQGPPCCIIIICLAMSAAQGIFQQLHLRADAFASSSSLPVPAQINGTNAGTKPAQLQTSRRLDDERLMQAL